MSFDSEKSQRTANTISIIFLTSRLDGSRASWTAGGSHSKDSHLISTSKPGLASFDSELPREIHLRSRLSKEAQSKAEPQKLSSSARQHANSTSKPGLASSDSKLPRENHLRSRPSKEAQSKAEPQRLSSSARQSNSTSKPDLGSLHSAHVPFPSSPSGFFIGSRPLFRWSRSLPLHQGTQTQLNSNHLKIETYDLAGSKWLRLNVMISYS